ncbi:NACHT domain-containing protein [Streptomyces sp. NPDC002755]|uniref:NACHT domain-containing protein n=1 Tax=Streptomyces sp. NPDC002884 TaxID=3154544 RepID=UPI003334495D
MGTRTKLGAERQVLRDRLRKLETDALRGRDRSGAIDQANERRRSKSLPELSTTTVGGWFEEGTPARDFETLWALVEVLLEWSGLPRPETVEGPAARGKAAARWTSTKELWQIRWQQAKDSRPIPEPRTAAQSRLTDGYLAAVRRTAGEHPYPDVWGDARLPGLADVYVRQQTRLQTSADRETLHEAAVPAENIFTRAGRMCVLLAPAGSGKSTLLRTHRASSAERWSEGHPSASVPVLVNAEVLSSADTVPAAMAKAATAELRRFGLLDDLTPDFFRHAPHPRTTWLVLVDGLDEIPDTASRRAIVQLLAATAADTSAPYRFVVATRPLPAQELDTLGEEVRRFELQPFSPEDLHRYATSWFRDLDDPARHSRAFMTGLRRSHLDVLARTPLIAFLLCRLYRADPDRPLPRGRTGAYRACVELLYELNAHKNIRATHDEVIRRLKDRHQIPRDNLAAERAAQQVREYLPEAIDFLAHARITGNAGRTTKVLSKHLHVNRPQRLDKHLWRAFLGDLLRPTGLLTEGPDDFHFLHQTFLEYHAARYATRDKAACARLLDELFPPGKKRQRPPAGEASRLGFLLDALLASPGGIPAETVDRLETFLMLGEGGCDFLTTQVQLRTNLPTKITAVYLTRFTKNESLDGEDRVEAAKCLAGLEALQDHGLGLLTRLAESPDFPDRHRVDAAVGLAGLHATRDSAARLIARLAGGVLRDGAERLRAADRLAEIEGHSDRAVQVMSRLAEDPALEGTYRLGAADRLAGMEGMSDRAVQVMTLLADDPAIEGAHRLGAADRLAGMEGMSDRAVQVLTRLTDDSALDGACRLRAADRLAGMEGMSDRAVQVLTRLADDPALVGAHRLGAADRLAGMEGMSDCAVQVLTRLTEDPALEGTYRMTAADRLAGMPDRAAQVMIRLAEDPALEDCHRVQAAENLTWRDASHEEGVGRLLALAEDAAVSGAFRVQAVEALAVMDGMRDRAARLFTRLAEDAAVSGAFRVQAVEALAVMDGMRDRAARLFTRLAEDLLLPGTYRVQAAVKLAGVDGTQDRSVQALARLAEDPALAPTHRVHAARSLTEVDRSQQRSVQALVRLAEDPALPGAYRLRAVETLSRMDGMRDRVARLFTRLGEDPVLDETHRVRAQKGLAAVGRQRSPQGPAPLPPRPGTGADRC